MEQSLSTSAGVTGFASDHSPIRGYLDGTKCISLFAERHGGKASQIYYDVLLNSVLWNLADESGQESVQNHETKHQVILEAKR